MNTSSARPCYCLSLMTDHVAGADGCGYTADFIERDPCTRCGTRTDPGAILCDGCYARALPAPCRCGLTVWAALPDVDAQCPACGEHRWQSVLRRSALLSCALCGAPVDDPADDRHALCAARAARGRATPPLTFPIPETPEERAASEARAWALLRKGRRLLAESRAESATRASAIDDYAYGEDC